MAVGARSLFTAAYEPLLFDVARVDWPQCHWSEPEPLEREARALDALEAALVTPTAAVILEPLIQGASGMAMVRPAFLQAVQQRVRAAGALLIADEVMTGFGRTGSLFACRRAGIQPDLMALSKGLTGGFLPMGVTLASERLYLDGSDQRALNQLMLDACRVHWQRRPVDWEHCAIEGGWTSPILGKCSVRGLAFLALPHVYFQRHNVVRENLEQAVVCHPNAPKNQAEKIEIFRALGLWDN